MNKRIALWGGLAVAIVGLVLLLATFGNEPLPESGATISSNIAAGEHVKGNPDAKTTLVEYSDFECPACAGFYPTVKALAEAYPDDLRVVYRHFPLNQIHRNAEAASYASEAAAAQGKFWEMHDMIFNTQSQWQHLSDTTEFFVTLAQSLELDIDRFRTDMDSKATRDKVAGDLAKANSARLRGTPSFFLNGVQMTNFRTYDEFTRQVEAAINAAK